MGKFNDLLAQLQMDDPHVSVEHALHSVVFISHNAKIRDFLELQYFFEELRLPLEIVNRKAHHLHPLHIARETLARAGAMPARHHQGGEESQRGKQDAGGVHNPCHLSSPPPRNQSLDRATLKMSVMIVSSDMPAPAALGCCAPDFGSLYIASIVRRMLTWVRPLPSG